MGNYTYPSFLSRRTVCRNGEMIRGSSEHSSFTIQWNLRSHLNLNGTAIFMLPVFIQGDATYLRFISCGMRGFERFFITDTLHILDALTWLLLTLSLIYLTAIFISASHPQARCIATSFSTFRSVLKLLSEQSDSLPLRLMQMRFY